MAIDVCPGCDTGFEFLGTHWRYYSDHRPKLSDRQKEISLGLMLGDGGINRHHSPNLQCNMVTPSFLRWVDEEMGIFGTGVTLTEEKSEYPDVYRWSSRVHPFFEGLSEWYSSGEKRFPGSLQLSPLILKVWFCGDGNKSVEPRENRGECRPVFRIASRNEIHREGFLKGLFSDIGVEPTITGGYIQFGVDDSERLWEYIGDPLPGFEYKWPES